MGKKCGFDCFEGYKECESIVFTDAGGNSFTMNVYLRGYKKGIVSMSWPGGSGTMNGTPSLGPFTGSKQVLKCNFKSDMAMTSVRHPVLTTAVISAAATNLTGYLTFNASGYPVIYLNIGTDVPDASTAYSVYGGSVTWPQDC